MSTIDERIASYGYSSRVSYNISFTFHSEIRGADMFFFVFANTRLVLRRNIRLRKCIRI